MLSLLEIEKTRTTAYHPMGNGQVENFNKSIKSMLTTTVNDMGNDWDEKLQSCLMAFRSSEQESTGETPFFMTFGSEMTLPLDLLVSPPEEPVHLTKFSQDMCRNLTEAHQRVHDHLGKAQRRQTANYDRFAQRGGYNVGDRVWRYSHALKTDEAAKFHKRWMGPYIIVEKISEVTYRVQLEGGLGTKVRTVHFNDLKLCHGPIVEVSPNKSRMKKHRRLRPHQPPVRPSAHQGRDTAG
ncbi:uncharacterized protein LOC141907795 [Tubulanus polymorphus]|uniref:uncharacterized protein LOC141907795 n=1 Tax=Tubulanus polymorphus TaxID=672921 RepID=UPI003DA6A0A0